ncbi:MAG: DUF4190 domain-containing protein [Actinobacteria bacterium]|nr:DUF4190 domain-containing protein [Actinomycetota bacterium]
MDQNPPPPSDPPGGWQGEQQSWQGQQGQQPQYSNPPWQGQPGQPSYGAPGGGYGYPGQQIDHPKGMTAFIMSLLGLVVCTPLGIVGLVMGRNAQRDVDANPGMYANAGLVKAAVIMGWIATILIIVGIVGAVLFFGGLIATGAGSN